MLLVLHPVLGEIVAQALDFGSVAGLHHQLKSTLRIGVAPLLDVLVHGFQDVDGQHCPRFRLKYFRRQLLSGLGHLSTQ
jgi:hypothetical protein